MNLETPGPLPLPERVVNKLDVLRLLFWLERNRVYREPITEAQHEKITQLIREADQWWQSVSSNMHACHLGAALRSGLDVSKLW